MQSAQFANELHISLSHFHYMLSMCIAIFFHYLSVFFFTCIRRTFACIPTIFDTENLSNFRLHQIQYYVKLLIQKMQLHTADTHKVGIALDLAQV